LASRNDASAKFKLANKHFKFQLHFAALAALGLTSNKKNWHFVTNFNSMIKGLLTKDIARHERKYLL
jgi:hypothetical protein